MTAIYQAQLTVIIIVLTITVSVAGFSNSRIIDAAMLDVQRILKNREYYRMATSGLVHADPMHLFINMLTMFFFGPPVEIAIGKPAFLFLYVVCLLAGSAWALLENLRNPTYRALGASGAISGVTACFALLMPFAIINLFFFVSLPAIVFAVLYIGWSIYAVGRVNDGIGHAAHLGGALMGVVLTCLFWPSGIHQITDRFLTLFGG